jgi:hypothetical protein
MKRSIFVLATAIATTALCGVAAQADTLAHTFFPGHGDPQDFVVQNLSNGSDAIQLGLEAQPRGVGAALNKVGDTYIANAGGSGGKALWNFDFAIDTNPNGTSTILLSQLTATISVTGPGGVSGTLLPLIIPDNNAAPDKGSTTLAQNSENLGFHTFGLSDTEALAGFDPSVAGLYTFTLNVSGPGILGSDTMNVEVVPVPASAKSGLALLAGLGLVQVARRRQAGGSL